MSNFGKMGNFYNSAKSQKIKKPFDTLPVKVYIYCMHKSTAAELNIRVTQVYKWLTEGYRVTDILQNARKKWSLKSDEQIQNYIKKATDIIKAENFKEVEQLRIEHSARYDELYHALRAKGKLVDAGKILAWKSKINGLEAVPQNNVNINSGENSTIKVEFVDAKPKDNEPQNTESV